MKRVLYIAAFTLLGLLTATLVHAGFEMPFLHLLANDYASYGDTLLWRHWEFVHGMGSVLLWILGAGIGYFLGRYFWHIRYGQSID